LSRAYTYQGMVAMQMGDYELARRALSTGLEIAERDDAWTIALAETWASLLAHALGEYGAAERLFRAGLARYRAIGNPRCLVFCLTFCSTTLVAIGKSQEAQALLRESLMLAGAADDRFGMAITLQHLGHLALEQHDAPEAVYLFREALALMRATGSRWDITRILNQFGAALCAVGDSARAAAIYREALATALEVQAIPDALQALAGVATQLHRTGRYAEALGLCARVIADPASRIETRDQAVRLHATLMSQVPADQIAVIERQARELPLAQFQAHCIDSNIHCP
jgi:tetratricopeptide (TPR) repeat protein